MVMRALIFIIIYFCTITTSILPKFIFSKLVNIDRNNISLVNTIETKNCFASYVMIEGVLYLVKQKKDYNKIQQGLANFRKL